MDVKLKYIVRSFVVTLIKRGWMPFLINFYLVCSIKFVKLENLPPSFWLCFSQVFFCHCHSHCRLKVYNSHSSKEESLSITYDT